MTGEREQYAGEYLNFEFHTLQQVDFRRSIFKQTQLYEVASKQDASRMLCKQFLKANFFCRKALRSAVFIRMTARIYSAMFLCCAEIPSSSQGKELMLQNLPFSLILCILHTYILHLYLYKQSLAYLAELSENIRNRKMCYVD